jgi:hypothetical protein
MSTGQERDGGDGLNRPRIVEGQLNWNGPEKVVQGDPIANESTSRLKQNVSVPHASVAGDRSGVKNPLKGGLIDCIREDSKDLWRKWGGLSSHRATISQSVRDNVHAKRKTSG